MESIELTDGSVLEETSETKVQYKEIPQTPIEKAFGNYWFVHADYSEGLNYGVSKELINRDLSTIEKVIKEPIEKVENSLSTKDYLEMMFPLLQKVQALWKER